jgi:hypothetical protein
MAARPFGQVFHRSACCPFRNFQRMKYPLVACLALPGLAQSALISSDVRFGSKADVAAFPINVRFIASVSTLWSITGLGWSLTGPAWSITLSVINELIANDTAIRHGLTLPAAPAVADIGVIDHAL